MILKPAVRFLSDLDQVVGFSPFAEDEKAAFNDVVGGNREGEIGHASVVEINTAFHDRTAGFAPGFGDPAGDEQIR